MDEYDDASVRYMDDNSRQNLTTSSRSRKSGHGKAHGQAFVASKGNVGTVSDIAQSLRMGHQMQAYRWICRNLSM